MKCPYCGNDMLQGYIQARDGVYWAEKLRPVAAISILSGSMISLQSGETGAFTGHTAIAYRCKECKKVIIDYAK